MFGNFLESILAFLVALGVLIAIHEFGHFWVARKMDVKVLKFSIGFGRSLFSRRGKVDNTEYALAMIPLGGYVRMLDEREGNVKPQELHRAFNRKSVWARFAIVLAGPMANFLLAILVYWVVFMTGISGIAPLLGDIAVDTPASDAGFQREDRITAINGKSVASWNDAHIALVQQAVSGNVPVAVDVETIEGNRTTRELALDPKTFLHQSGDAVQQTGLSPWWPVVDPVIGGLEADGAAAAAGMLIEDRVVRVNEQPIENWRDWVLVVQANPETELVVDVEREGEPVQLLVTPRKIERNDRELGYVGARETQSEAQSEKLYITVKYPMGEAFSRALQKTWDISILTLRMLGKLVMGNASLDNISGPITIAQFAGQSASIGLDHYLNFIALISISLAVLNLLPIPMLDGGHLFYYTIEAIAGKPVPERVQLVGQQFGLAILGGLMLLAFYNDLWRLLG